MNVSASTSSSSLAASTNSVQLQGTGTGRIQQQLSSAKQLSQALESGDMATAKQSYATMARTAAANGKTWDSDSSFAQLGKALQSGDVDAAKTALGDMAQNVKDELPAPPSGGPVQAPTRPQPVTSSTGGVAGTTLNIQA